VSIFQAHDFLSCVWAVAQQLKLLEKENITMKEIKVFCTMYINCEDDETEEEAVDRLLMYIDPEVNVNVHDYEFQSL
jgi:hypothetical protein